MCNRSALPVTCEQARLARLQATGTWRTNNKKISKRHNRAVQADLLHTKIRLGFFVSFY